MAKGSIDKRLKLCGCCSRCDRHCLCGHDGACDRDAAWGYDDMDYGVCDDIGLEPCEYHTSEARLVVRWARGKPLVAPEPKPSDAGERVTRSMP